MLGMIRCSRLLVAACLSVPGIALRQYGKRAHVYAEDICSVHATNMSKSLLLLPKAYAVVGRPL